MKRLVFCFDGTWNALNADTPTNVVLTAASIVREAADGISQVIHYDEGVGTGRLERFSGGMLGAGLIQNVREAYRFLLFNYDVGDQIFVFGFSRGAFSAQTFVGFLRHVGPLRRLHAARIDEALELYRQRLSGADGSSERMRRFRAEYSSNVCIGSEDDDWRCGNVEDYRKGFAPPLTIRYLGLWDTVSALGVPAILPFSSRINRRHAFHDASLTSFVERARHAVAIDERRVLFPPMLWGDLNEVNKLHDFDPDDPNAPYQEAWFPGTHGSVGGGGDVRGLSDGALAWVLKGAKLAGLRLDQERGSRIHGFSPDPLAPIQNVKAPSPGLTGMVTTDRDGPVHAWQVSKSAIRRWNAPAEKLPERRAYRPKALACVKRELDMLGAHPTLTDGDASFVTHVVKPGESLRRIALQHYGSASQSDAIFAANRDMLDDPDDIFVGQTLRVPIEHQQVGSTIP